MAAGLSLQPDNLEVFKRGMNKTILNQAAGRGFKPDLVIDARKTPSAITLEFARSLDLLAPFGPGNPPLVFAAQGMEIVNTTPVGKLGEHMLVDVADANGDPARLIWWNGKDRPLPEGRFDLAYSARASNFRAEDQVQFEWIDYRQIIDEISLSDIKEEAKSINVDYRSSNSPDKDLYSLLQTQTICVWKEGNDNYPVDGIDRHAITPSSALAIWTVPPDINVLRQLIQTVNPARIYWFLVPPKQHRIREFLLSIGSMITQGFQHGQQHFRFEDLAARTATTDKITSLGLQWLASSGQIRVLERDQTGCTIAPGGAVDLNQRGSLENDLTQAFKEMHSFSLYLKRDVLEKLVDEISEF